MIKQQIAEQLKQAVAELGFEPTDIVISISTNPSFGDYSSNIALQLAKQKSKKGEQSPMDIAKDLAEHLESSNWTIQIATPGFLNFTVDSQVLASNIAEIINNPADFGRNQIGSGQEARVEFVSANPTGPMHIGNARGGPLGDVLASVLEYSGYKVTREYIHNDVGGQVKVLGSTILAINHPDKALDKTGSSQSYSGTYINELAPKVDQLMRQQIADYDSLSPEQYIDQAGKRAVDLMLEEILADCSAMGVKFDSIVNESQLQSDVPEVIAELEQKGVVKAKDGALWLAPSDEFLKDRETVVRKSNGEFTYFSSDIVYHKQKFESGANLIVDVFGSNHHGHIPRLQAAVSALGFDPDKLRFILYQYVRVKRGSEILKMSKRAGTFVIAREVLDEVGKDAFRFYLLSYSPETHIDFDLEAAKEKSNKNPVYYVQYAHARMWGIEHKSEANIQLSDQHLNLLVHPKETALIKDLLEFPDLIQRVASDFQVQQLTIYALGLAERFHHFYEACQVVNAESEQLKSARMALVHASQTVLKSTLQLMGISAPERM